MVITILEEAIKKMNKMTVKQIKEENTSLDMVIGVLEDLKDTKESYEKCMKGKNKER